MGKVSIEQSIPEWSITQTSETNSALSLAKATVANHRHVVTGFEVVLTGAAATDDISIQLNDGNTVKYQTYIGKAAAQGTRVAVAFAHGVEMSVNSAASLSVSAGGASAVTTANMVGYTK